MVLVFPLRSLRLCGEITPFTIFKRLKRIGDIWKKVLGKGIDMEKALKKLEKEWKKIKQ